MPKSPPPSRPKHGKAGESARREFERRTASRELRVRESHPILGGLLLALTRVPQSTTAWKIGAEGEERLGARLDKLTSPTTLVLHDRRIPGTRANIDHLVVTQFGITVIDAKRYRGRPQLKVRHQLFRPNLEELYVDGRNCTKLVDGVRWQADRVRSAINEPGLAVRAMLCFIDADWPLTGGALQTRGVDIVWPRRAERLLMRSGAHDQATVELAHSSLLKTFPPA